MKNNRMERVSSEIQKHLGEIIQSLQNDELANEIISILKVETFADFSLAKVYISSIGSLERKKHIAEILNRNKKTIRYDLAHKVMFKNVPELLFIADDTEERAERILKLFEKIETENKDEN